VRRQVSAATWRAEADQRPIMLAFFPVVVDARRIRPHVVVGCDACWRRA
jgi:hypothetical protein